MTHVRNMLNTLPAFVEAARLGSFTKAAEKLGMPQPSVSRFIHNLEMSLGLDLFNRNYNQIELTEDGKILFDAVAPGLDNINRTISTLKENQKNTTITIGCSHGFSHLWLQARLSKIQKLLPQYSLQLITTDPSITLTHEDVSCTVRFGDGKWTDCESRLLFREEVFPVCTSEFAQKNNITDTKSLTPNILRDLPLIAQKSDNLSYLTWQGWFAHYAISYEMASNVQSINTYAFTLQTALEGNGVALMWDDLDSPYLERGWLIELGQLRVKTENAYYITFPKNSPFANNFSRAFG